VNVKDKSGGKSRLRPGKKEKPGNEKKRAQGEKQQAGKWNSRQWSKSRGGLRKFRARQKLRRRNLDTEKKSRKKRISSLRKGRRNGNHL